MTLSLDTISARPTRSGAVAAVAALTLAAAVCAAGSTLLPALYARTLLPGAAGLSSGALLALWISARSHPDWRARARLTAFALGLGWTLIAVVLLAVPQALDPGHFGYWMPSVAGPAAAVWAAAYLVERRLGRRVPLFTAAMAALALAAVLLHNAALFHGALRGEHLRTWNVYHYYLGSKYFAELGYRDLYPATLAADDQWQRAKAAMPEAERERADAVEDFRHIERTRDMRDYRVVPRQELTRHYDPGAFDSERWQSFGEDTRILRSRYHTEGWKDVLTDWGLNPTPAWMVVGEPLSNLIDLDRPLFLLIANSDLPLFVLIFAALWWAYGPRTALAAVVWVNVIHFNRGRLVGGFLQYDWLASAVIALALYHRQRPAAAGMALGWAVMTRAFPVFITLPLMAKMLVDLARGQGTLLGRPQRRHLRFFTALCASSLLLLSASLFTSRGPDAWFQWLDKITLHRAALDLDPMQLGAGRLAQHQPSGDDFWASRKPSPQGADAGSGPVWLALRIAGGLLLLGALWRRRDEDAMILMLFAIFLALTLTRYYGTVWVLMFLLAAREGLDRIDWPAAVAGTSLLAMAAWFYAPGGQAARYFWANYQAFALFAGLCAGYIAADLRLRRKTTASQPPAGSAGSIGVSVRRKIS